MQGQPVPGTSIVLKIQLYPQGWGENLHLFGMPHLSCASTKIPLPVAGKQIWKMQLGFEQPQAYSVFTSDFFQFCLNRETRRSLFLLCPGKFHLISAKWELIPFKSTL